MAALLMVLAACGQATPNGGDTPSVSVSTSVSASGTVPSESVHTPQTPGSASPTTGLPTTPAESHPPTGPRVEPGPRGSLPPRYPWTVTGKVTRAEAIGCLLLVAEDATYELLGKDSVLPEVGQRVTVIGHVDRTLSHQCSNATPLEVESVTAQ